LGRAGFLLLALMLVAAAPAAADDWLPHPVAAQWQYVWADTTYNPTGTIENVVVQKQVGTTFTLAWADPQDQPPTPDQTSLNCNSMLTSNGIQTPDVGVVTFRDSNTGLDNIDWNSCPPPFYAPILCASASNCANSLSGVFYNVIWGNRVPVLSEPLLKGVSWTATGGAQNDVSSSSTYLGTQTVKVPAFPKGVVAAVVQTNIVQAGALGDPYGSGIRTTWWVRGVGPVRVVFQHQGAYGAPVTNVTLLSTNLTPQPVQPDADYFPLRQGLTHKYSITNSRHMTQAEVESVTVAAAANRTARLTVKSISGPMKVAGSYIFTDRLDGITNLFGSASAATLVKWPKLGHGRHFLSPIDLMVFGFGPLLPAYAQTGATWKSGSPTDFSTFGVTGTTRILGLQRVTVPAGRFMALEVQSTLSQKGYSFGSGTRTMWFAPGVGLVKLLFRHGDHSNTVVQLVK
jgi:hypothetical protein